MNRRKNAWRELHPEADGADRRLFWSNELSVDLFDSEECARTLPLVRKHPTALVVIDTLGATCGAANLDSSNSDARVIGRNLRSISDACGGPVLVLTHLTEKHASPGHLLGPSALEQDADAIWLMTNENGILHLVNTKQRDAEAAPPIDLRLVKRGGSLVVDEPEGVALDMAYFESARTMDEVCTHLGMSRTSADRLMQKLVSEGQLVREKDGKRFTFKVAA